MAAAHFRSLHRKGRPKKKALLMLCPSHSTLQQILSACLRHAFIALSLGPDPLPRSMDAVIRLGDKGLASMRSDRGPE
ncbi:hypothetical protein HNY73_005262 [Argiope bruennichi]|uniref:Uncharacterized protein n=1 Tax=Argiope bruennichi TaxID=94029 RepID=A0A8T0FGT7_ARGBR|nr:hypothetical protein HNY73_005262 [Argiope bruennichi]